MALRQAVASGAARAGTGGGVATPGRGAPLFTLDATDVATGWTELEPVPDKGQAAVFAAIRGRLPFPLLGIDSDNGGEFINAHLFRYC